MQLLPNDLLFTLNMQMPEQLLNLTLKWSHCHYLLPLKINKIWPLLLFFNVIVIFPKERILYFTAVNFAPFCGHSFCGRFRATHPVNKTGLWCTVLILLPGPWTLITVIEKNMITVHQLILRPWPGQSLTSQQSTQRLKVTKY
jgi:hypothetical protein